MLDNKFYAAQNVDRRILRAPKLRIPQSGDERMEERHEWMKEKEGEDEKIAISHVFSRVVCI